MKRFLPILAVCAFLLPALHVAQAEDVSVNFFYENLSGGNWYEVADYGYVWQPDAATNPSWRPYTDGYWAYTDQGWTWVSYEDFGWATYHYGRWARLADYGWVWMPGTEWAPAWVSWRTGGDYVGWAPLPPAGGGEVVYEGRPITGQVDVQFGIGPAYYNFIDMRYIGEPVLRDRILDYNQNVTYITNTVNVTNITYNNSTVYTYGPDYATLSAYSTRPIQRLKLERESANPFQAVKSGSMTKVQGNKLLVAAPMKLQKASAQAAPTQVKAKIEQPKVEKGWANISDPAEKARLEQKFKAENPKNVPKPDIQPKSASAPATNAAATGGGAVPQSAAASPAQRAGKGKQKGEKFQPQPAASAAPAAAANAPEQGRKNKVREERGRATPAPSPAGARLNERENATGPANTTPRENARSRENATERQNATKRESATPRENVTPRESARGEEAPGRNKSNKRQPNVAPTTSPQAQSGGNERNEFTRRGQNPNVPAAPARLNEGQANRAEQQARRPEQPVRPNEQPARRAQTQNAPGAGNAARGRSEQAQTPGRPAQQRPQPTAEAKAKQKKKENGATPPPQ